MADQREVANQAQEKFQFYVIALVFTILGLSIQTYSGSALASARLIEIFSWFSLLVSGLAGLSYLEWTPIIHEKIALLDETNESAHNFNREKLQGTTTVHLPQGKSVSIEERIETYEKRANAISNVLKELEKKSHFKYVVFKNKKRDRHSLSSAFRTVTR